jgi:hypothetical protein
MVLADILRLLVLKFSQQQIRKNNEDQKLCLFCYPSRIYNYLQCYSLPRSKIAICDFFHIQFISLLAVSLFSGLPFGLFKKLKKIDLCLWHLIKMFNIIGKKFGLCLNFMRYGNPDCSFILASISPWRSSNSVPFLSNLISQNTFDRCRVGWYEEEEAS